MSRNSEDEELGMQQGITRRDFVQGSLVLGLGSGLVPFTSSSSALTHASVYPPARSGLRGNHQGSYEVTHQLVQEGLQWQPMADRRTEEYDLVIVGAGISGLAAAYMHRQQNEDARILIFDNHDDFGGHAKRNEFEVNGEKLIGYGGSQTLESPQQYSETTMTFLREIGLDLRRFDSAFDHGFYRRHGLSGGIYFNKESWGVDRTVAIDLETLAYIHELAPAGNTLEQAVAQMPISSAARKQLLNLLSSKQDRLASMSKGERIEYLWSISYREFLARHCDITENEVFSLLQDWAADTGVGIEAATALDALSYMALPGVSASGLSFPHASDLYIHHFPDGNAAIARLLVRHLLPTVASGKNMDDIVLAEFDYSKLDESENQVRIRLNSTVVSVKQLGPATGPVEIGYVNAGRKGVVRAKHCILACNNAVIPYLCPQLPAEQKQALAAQVRSPILYTTVALTNWRAWKEMGLGAVVSPGSYHINAMLDFPVSMGGYRYTENPNRPVLVHMEKFLHRNNQGLSVKEQHRAGRQELLATPFSDIERQVRRQLNGMLGVHGFDVKKDIAGITVNRWAHGYAYSYSPLFDEIYDDDDDPRYPHIRARMPFGSIAIANSDAGASATINSAIEQAYRAVKDLA